MFTPQSWKPWEDHINTEATRLRALEKRVGDTHLELAQALSGIVDALTERMDHLETRLAESERENVQLRKLVENTVNLKTASAKPARIARLGVVGATVDLPSDHV